MASEPVQSIEIPDTQVAPETQPAQDSQEPNTQAYTESQVLAGQNGKEDSVEMTAMLDHFTDAQSGQQEEQMVESEAPDETTEKPSCESLLRSNAFLEEPFEDQIQCKKCGCPAELSTVVIRGPKEIWCRSCNALYTLLQRNMCWPPKEFQMLDETQQAKFFQKCAEDKRASEAGKFSYARVRETLCRSLVDEEIRQRKISVGGTYWPKSVYLKKGYELDADFEDRNPSQWSDSLQCWTYLVTEVSIHETEIKQSIERCIIDAERQVKKRRAAQIEEAEASEAKSAKTDATVVMDLLTESEDEAEGQVCHCIFLICFAKSAFEFLIKQCLQRCRFICEYI